MSEAHSFHSNIEGQGKRNINIIVGDKAFAQGKDSLRKASKDSCGILTIMLSLLVAYQSLAA